MVIAGFLGVILPSLRGLEPVPDPEARRRLADRVIDLWMDGVELHPRPEAP
jgi:hypothetical protein